MLSTIYQVGMGPCPVVLGLRLQPLTVGHALILSRLGSPFAVGGKVALPHLMEAVAVCSQPLSTATAALSSPWRPVFVWLWLRKIRRMNLTQERERFSNWLTEQHGNVECWQEAGKEPVMPSAERMLAAVCSELHQSAEAALEFPVAAASRLLIAKAEMHGQAEPVSEADRYVIEYARNHPLPQPGRITEN
jgi:hypothetical protein